MNDSLFRSINPERFLQVKRKQEQFSYQEFFSQKKLQQEDHGAVCLITNEQVVTIVRFTISTVQRPLPLQILLFSH